MENFICDNCNDIITSDNVEVSLYLIKNLKRDLELLFKKYVNLTSDSMRVKIKILKDFKYIIEVECLTDFLLGGDNIS